MSALRFSRGRELTDFDPNPSAFESSPVPSKQVRSQRRFPKQSGAHRRLRVVSIELMSDR